MLKEYRLVALVLGILGVIVLGVALACVSTNSSDNELFQEAIKRSCSVIRAEHGVEIICPPFKRGEGTP